MKIIAQTKRLYLREFKISDAIHLYNMNLDQEVIKYTGDVAFNTISQAETFISNYDAYARTKMGRWSVCLRNNHNVLGWCGLKYHPGADIVEVGYRFYRNYWNNGYATESTNLALKYGFDVLNLNVIYAHAHVDNGASHRVLEKCGLVFVKNQNYKGMPIKLFKIENELN